MNSISNFSFYNDQEYYENNKNNKNNSIIFGFSTYAETDFISKETDLLNWNNLSLSSMVTNVQQINTFDSGLKYKKINFFKKK